MAGVGYADYAKASLIVVWGANPASSGIHLLPHIQAAQKAGAKLVVVDPRRTKLARKADLHLALRPGTDLPLALATAARLFENGHADTEFLEKHARGVDEFRRRAKAWSIARAAEVCGLEAGDIETFSRLYAGTEPAVIRCGWGLERNRNGGSAVAAVLALPAVAGKFGVRGGGYTMSNSSHWGLDAASTAGAEVPPVRTVNMNRLGQVLSANTSPPVQVLFVYNCNPAVTMPHQTEVLRGLARDDLFTVVFDSFLTDTARYADVVLPATTFLERREMSKGYGSFALQQSMPATAPVGESRTNHEVFLDLCRRLGLANDGDLETEDAVAAAVLDAAGHGERKETLEREGITLPGFGQNPVQFQDVFPRTPDGKVDLVPEALDTEAPEGLYTYLEDPATEAYPLALVSPATIRTINSTLGQLHRDAATLKIHPEDAEARGIADGDPVRVWNELGEVKVRAEITPDMRPGVLELEKGLWTRNTANGLTSNALVPDTLTDLGGGACFNDARVQVEPSE
jgi:anaerobic selenocysteine-containing dehydrogenase